MPKVIIDYDEIYIPFTVDEKTHLERYDDQKGFDCNSVEITDDEFETIETFWKSYNDYRSLIRSIENRAQQ